MTVYLFGNLDKVKLRRWRQPSRSVASYLGADVTSLPYEKGNTQRTDEDRKRDREKMREWRQRHRKVKDCVKCGTPLVGMQKKYCSSENCKPRKRGSSLNHNKQCVELGCDRPVLARELCGSHYSTWHRNQKKYQIVCVICGDTVNVPASNATTCSRACAALAGSRASAARWEGREAVEKELTCGYCGQGFSALNERKYCDDSCRLASSRKKAKKSWSPLRKAFEAQDGEGMISAIEQCVEKTESGCWEWARRLRKGYPEVTIAGNVHQVHRLALEAKMKAPLGSQAAHHVCANSKCVNPDHLQPVTHRENVAEMLARHSYLARIAELEDALTELKPDHPALQAIPIK